LDSGPVRWEKKEGTDYEIDEYNGEIIFLNTAIGINDKVEVETEGIEAFMGSRVHDTLEKLYRDLKLTKLNSLEDLILYYHEVWEKNWNGMVLITRKGYEAEDYRRLGEKCISDYYKRYYPFEDGKTLGLEEFINFPLDKEKAYWIRGVYRSCQSQGWLFARDS
jgi:hypothetical protein